MFLAVFFVLGVMALLFYHGFCWMTHLSVNKFFPFFFFLVLHKTRGIKDYMYDIVQCEKI